MRKRVETTCDLCRSPQCQVSGGILCQQRQKAMGKPPRDKMVRRPQKSKGAGAFYRQQS